MAYSQSAVYPQHPRKLCTLSCQLNLCWLGKRACLHALLFGLGVVPRWEWCIQVSSPVAMCYINKSQFDCMGFKFSFNVWHQQSHFLVKHSGDALSTYLCHKQVFMQDRRNWTSAIAHSVSYLIHIDLATAWDGRPDRGSPSSFKACSALTKLGCPTTFDCGIWQSIFTVNNDHSIVYLLQLNVLQSQKFNHRIIADFVKIRHAVLPAHFSKLHLLK